MSVAFALYADDTGGKTYKLSDMPSEAAISDILLSSYAHATEHNPKPHGRRGFGTLYFGGHAIFVPQPPPEVLIYYNIWVDDYYVLPRFWGWLRSRRGDTTANDPTD